MNLQQFERDNNVFEAQLAVLERCGRETQQMVRMVRSWRIRRYPVGASTLPISGMLPLALFVIGFVMVGYSQQPQPPKHENLYTFNVVNLTDGTLFFEKIPVGAQQGCGKGVTDPPERCICCCYWPECGGHLCCRINDCAKYGIAPNASKKTEVPK